MAVTFMIEGESRSFPEGAIAMAGEGLVLAGRPRGVCRTEAGNADFVAVELGTECLGEHVGLEPQSGLRKFVGFARFRLGEGAPTQLIELVSLPNTEPAAVAAAQAAVAQVASRHASRTPACRAETTTATRSSQACRARGVRVAPIR